MPARKSATKKKADQAPSFEEALEGLESIVESMENEQLPLEDLVTYYEKGSKLLDRCESILESAKDRIELITLRNKNESELENPASSGDATPADTSGESAADDDIRLF